MDEILRIEVRKGCDGCPLQEIVNYEQRKYRCRANMEQGVIEERARFYDGKDHHVTKVLKGCPLLKRGQVVVTSGWIAEDQIILQKKIDGDG